VEQAAPALNNGKAVVLLVVRSEIAAIEVRGEGGEQEPAEAGGADRDAERCRRLAHLLDGDVADAEDGQPGGAAEGERCRGFSEELGCQRKALPCAEMVAISLE
jgi:hypothetical protein